MNKEQKTSNKQQGTDSLLRVPLSELPEGECRLPTAAARYVSRVHRLGVGDRFVAFDPAARLEADAVVVELSGGVVVRVGGARPASVVATRPVTVIQALAKGTKVDAVVRDATELGATTIVIAHTARSVKRGDHLSRWRRVALEAARQSGRGDVPTLHSLAFVDAVEQHAPGENSIGVCMQPRADNVLGDVLADVGTDAAVAIVVGPEGGLTIDELALAQEHGFCPVALGPFVLRTETACAAALGAILATSRAK